MIIILCIIDIWFYHIIDANIELSLFLNTQYNCEMICYYFLQFLTDSLVAFFIKCKAYRM